LKGNNFREQYGNSKSKNMIAVNSYNFKKGKSIRITTGIFFICFLTFSASCNKNELESPIHTIEEISIFYTNDEHGWMEATVGSDGAAGMLGYWETEFGYDKSDSYLVLSGGDMWTGPAISTWFRGEPMVEVMNAMGYDAAAIGNHEFDFTVSGLKERLLETNFPLLSANIVEKSTGMIPSFAEPYIMKEVSGIKIGIIGLSSITTPYTSFPAYVQDFDFITYKDALDTFAPEVNDKGADMIIVIGHLCGFEMEALIQTAKEYNIVMIGGGHCHQEIARVVDGVLIIQGGAEMQGFGRVVLSYNTGTKEVSFPNFEYLPNNIGYSNKAIEQIVQKWKTKVSEQLDNTIGYCSETIFQSSIKMGNMVVDSWFYSFPEADISIANSGSIRQDIAQGDVTVESIVSLLPFENFILELDLTGAEVIDVSGGYLIGGMTTINGYSLSDGTPIHPDSIYSVLTTDYLYSITDNNMSAYDPEPYTTAVHYRQPLIDWIMSMETNAQDPLNNYLDGSAR